MNLLSNLAGLNPRVVVHEPGMPPRDVLRPYIMRYELGLEVACLMGTLELPDLLQTIGNVFAFGLAPSWTPNFELEILTTSDLEVSNNQGP